MKIPLDKAIIPDAKLESYLLIWRPKNDKSIFLAQAGFSEQRPDLLRKAIFQHIIEFEAVMDRTDEYGQFYRVEGDLIGPNGLILKVVTIWNQNTDETYFRFVTLKPMR